MAASGAKTLPTIGFLTVVEDTDWGLTGGLLVLNAAGRPLEFHCTAPLKPNRAQEILYGPTLRPFLYGEQIGQTLLSKAKSETLFVCTDTEPALCVREKVELPVVLIRSSGTARSEPDLAADQRQFRIDPAHAAPRSPRGLTEFMLGRHPAAARADFAADCPLVARRWEPYQDHWDLTEPFARIREALAEAQRGAAK